MNEMKLSQTFLQHRDLSLPGSVAGPVATEWNIWLLPLMKYTFQQARSSVISLNINCGVYFFLFLSPEHFLLISGFKKIG